MAKTLAPKCGRELVAGRTKASPAEVQDNASELKLRLKPARITDWLASGVRLSLKRYKHDNIRHFN